MWCKAKTSTWYKLEPSEERDLNWEDASIILACGLRLWDFCFLINDHNGRAYPIVGSITLASGPGCYIRKQAEQAIESK